MNPSVAKGDARLGHLPSLGRIIRFFGDRLEPPQGLYSLLIWRRQFLQLGLEDLPDGLHHRMEKLNVRASFSRFGVFLPCCSAASCVLNLFHDLGLV